MNDVRMKCVELASAAGAQGAELLSRAQDIFDWVSGGTPQVTTAALRGQTRLSHPEIENIIDKVADSAGFDRRHVVSARRTGPVVKARHIAMALALELTMFSTPDIGAAFGGRDHTTVLHAKKKCHDLIERVRSELPEDALLDAWVEAMFRHYDAECGEHERITRPQNDVRSAA